MIRPVTGGNAQPEGPDTGQAPYDDAPAAGSPSRSAGEVDSSGGDEEAPEPRRGEVDPIQRKTARLTLLSSIDRIFGSGRSEQGTIGKVSPLFVDKRKQLQEEIDRENRALNTVREAEASLEAFEESGQHEENLRASVGRENDAQDTTRGAEASRAAYEEHGQHEERLRGDVGREITHEDGLQQARTSKEALEESGLAEQAMQRDFDIEAQSMRKRQEALDALAIWLESGGELERLKREFSRVQGRFDTLQEASDTLEALERFGLREAELRNLRRRLDEGEDVRYLAQAQFEAMRDSIRHKMDIEAATIRYNGVADVLAKENARLQAFVASGAELSYRMNAQEMANALAVLEHVKPEELRIMRENATLLAREMGMAEAETDVAKLEFFAKAARDAHLQGEHDLAAAIRRRLEVGITGNWMERLFGGRR